MMDKSGLPSAVACWLDRHSWPLMNYLPHRHGFGVGYG